jgi:hypothetical protein
MIRMNACAASRPSGLVGSGHLACGTSADYRGPASPGWNLWRRVAIDRDRLRRVNEGQARTPSKPPSRVGFVGDSSGREPAVGGLSRVGSVWDDRTSCVSCVAAAKPQRAPRPVESGCSFR